MNKQDQYNEWFKSMLKKHLTHPYRLENKNHKGIDYLYAIISHLNDQEKDIHLSTYGREITLFIWKHHDHHDSFEDCDHEQEFVELCEYIDDIINDKVFFSVGYRGGKVAYGMCSYDIEKLIKENADTIEIISWSGNHDQTIQKKS